MAFDGRDFDPLASGGTRTKKAVVLRFRKDRLPVIFVLLFLSYLLFFLIGFLVGKMTSSQGTAEEKRVISPPTVTNQSSLPGPSEQANITEGEYVIKIEETNRTVIPVERRSTPREQIRSSTSIEKSTVSSSRSSVKKKRKTTSPAKRKTVSSGRPVSGFSIQVASFKSRKSALALVGKLKRRGYPAYYKKAVLSSGTFWRVRVGPFSSMALALKTRASLAQEGFKEAFIVRDKVYR